jgi:uncharacterized protein (TIGR04255 family)
MNCKNTTPLVGPSPSEIPLANAPLVRVLVQIRFPTILSIRTSDSDVASFQERIRSTYPILEREQAFNLVVSQQAAPPEVRPEVVWRFRDLKKAWQVTLTADFVTLEALEYSNRMDFVTRLEKVLAAVQLTFAPSVALRLGVRYVDCVRQPHVERIDHMVESAVLGISQTPLGQAAELNMTECLIDAEEGRIQGRWGLLPKDATHDPGVLLPSGEKSWVLDLDMFTTGQMPFDATELAELTRKFAERIYSVFRWMVTDEFLRVYGGEP